MSFSRSLLSSAISVAIFLANPIVYANEYQDEEIEESLEDFYGDEDFVSIATGTKMLISKAPSIATVITAEQIHQMGAQSVAEALESIPGLHVYPSPFNRLNTSFSIRGVHTDQNPQVLFLVNGLPVREEYTGSRPQTFRMPVHAVSRIEVIRGPGSAVYGADAYSGVINVITKSIDEIDKTSFGASYGSFNSTNIWYQDAFTVGDAKFSMTVETLKTDGDKDRVVTRDLQSIFDDILGTSASKAPTYLNTHDDIVDIRLAAEYNNIDANFWYWRNKDAGQGAGAGQALDPTGKQNTSIYQFDLSYDWQLAQWDSSARYSYYKMKDEAQFSVLPANTIVPLGADGNLNLVAPVGVALFTDGYIGNPQPTEKMHSLDFTFNSAQFAEHKIRVGFGASIRELTAREQKNFGPGVLDTEALALIAAQGGLMVVDGTLTDVTNTDYIFVKDVDRTNTYISFQDQWKFANDWELTSGIRYDHYDDFGSTINPRLALVWEVSQTISTKLLYGRAFRAPAFDTLHAINNPVGIGNPKLDPETIDTLEFSISQHLSTNLDWSINLFKYEAEKLIEFIPDEGTTNTTAQNEKDQSGYGLEAELNWQLDNHKISVNYSWQSSEDDATNIRVPLAPKQLFNANYFTELTDTLSFDAKLNWVGERTRDVGDSRKPLDNFSTVDMAVHWQFANNDSVTLSLIGKNIFDKSAHDPSHPLVPEALGPMSDYPIEGRSVYLQIAKNL